MDYIQDHIRDSIIKEIKDLELPYEWKPSEVINYIVRMIDKNGQAPR